MRRIVLEYKLPAISFMAPSCRDPVRALDFFLSDVFRLCVISPFPSLLQNIRLLFSIWCSTRHLGFPSSRAMRAHYKTEAECLVGSMAQRKAHGEMAVKRCSNVCSTSICFIFVYFFLRNVLLFKENCPQEVATCLQVGNVDESKLLADLDPQTLLTVVDNPSRSVLLIIRHYVNEVSFENQLCCDCELFAIPS